MPGNEKAQKIFEKNFFGPSVMARSAPAVPLDALLPHASVHTFVLDGGLRVVWCDVDGPLCSAHILAATQSVDDSGLAHTLEHLIFCGSGRWPHRGFLDTLANRSLSSGTNAWTSETYTAYTAVTAGPQGMGRLLPVLLDHVAHPTLRDAQFVTEVYHVDGEGKEQGVVFCEMAARENTEADLLDNTLRQMLYPHMAIAYEHGGKTRDIATRLDNRRIRDYHRHYYDPSRMTVVLCGKIDIEDTLKAIATVPAKAAAPSPSSSSSSSFEPTVPLDTPLPPLVSAAEPTIVRFPSRQDDVASIAFAWRGPSCTDLKTVAAFDVVYYFLTETVASPLNQAFVERPVPLATDIEYGKKEINR